MHKPPRPMLGIGLAMASLVLFVTLDVTTKHLSTRFPVPLLVWARYTVHCVLMVVLLAPSMRWRLLATGKPGLHVLRAFLLLATSFGGVAAFKRMPLAETTAIVFAAPLIVTLLARPLLGETIGRVRWLAVLVGFGGVLLVARPGSGLVLDGVLLALGTAVVYALYQLLTRKLSPTEHPLTLLFYTALIGSAATSAGLPWMDHGPSPTTQDLLQIGAMGVLAGLGHFLLTRAFREAPASVLSPMLYVQLLWAALFGWLAFDQIPDGLGLVGMAVIGLAGAIIAVDSRRLAAGAAAA